MTSKEIVKQKLSKLKDDLEHYTCVDKNSTEVFYIKKDIEEYEQILSDLERLENENRMLMGVPEIIEKERDIAIGKANFTIIENRGLRKTNKIFKKAFKTLIEVMGLRFLSREDCTFEEFWIETNIIGEGGLEKTIDLSKEEYKLLKEASKE